MPVRIGMKAVEAKQSLGIPVGVGDIIFIGFVVNSGHVPAGVPSATTDIGGELRVAFAYALPHALKAFVIAIASDG